MDQSWYVKCNVALLFGKMDFDASDYPPDIADDISRSRPIVVGKFVRNSGRTAWVDSEVGDFRRVQTREAWSIEIWEPSWLVPTHWQPLPQPPKPTE